MSEEKYILPDVAITLSVKTPCLPFFFLSLHCSYYCMPRKMIKFQGRSFGTRDVIRLYNGEWLTVTVTTPNGAACEQGNPRGHRV